MKDLLTIMLAVLSFLGACYAPVITGIILGLLLVLAIILFSIDSDSKKINNND